MEARGAALAAQTASVDDLLAVLVRVKAGLEDQIALVEGDLGRAQEELERRQELLERGLAREMDVAGAETSLSNLRLRLVEMNTQYLTLEKDLSEARRGRDTLGQTREVEILQELNRNDGLTVLVTLHQVDYAVRYCRRVVALKAGKVVYDGPSDGLDRPMLIDIYGPEIEDVMWEKA